MPGTLFQPVRLAVLLLAAFCSPIGAQDAVTSPVRQFLKEGDSAFAQGDYASARRSFEEAQKIAQQLPADSPIRYEVLKRLTSTSAASGQFADAERYIQQAVEWRASTIGPKDPKIADDLLLSVNLDMRTKEFDQALATAQRVRAMHTEAYTPESIPVADDLLRIGQIYLAEKKPNEAERSLVAALDIRTKLGGSLDPGQLPILDQLIESFRAIDGGPGTETFYRQALTIGETLYGDKSGELISTIEGLANVLFGRGDVRCCGTALPAFARIVERHRWGRPSHGRGSAGQAGGVLREGRKAPEGARSIGTIGCHSGAFSGGRFVAPSHGCNRRK
jgi:tetratricopeptide (TPR) repeat protein